MNRAIVVLSLLGYWSFAVHSAQANPSKIMRRTLFGVLAVKTLSRVGSHQRITSQRLSRLASVARSEHSLDLVSPQFQDREVEVIRISKALASLKSSRPENYRSTDEVNLKLTQNRLPHLNLSGFDELHLSASASPSEADIEFIKNQSKSGRSTLILDLQKEPHPLINGDKVIFYRNYNTANDGKSREKIIQDENQLVTELRRKFLERHHRLDLREFEDDHFDYSNQQKRDAGHPIHSIAVAKVQTEESVVQNHTLHYERIPVSDLHSPTSEQADEFIQLFKKMKTYPEWPHLHIHCMAGRGRTTTFQVMYDLLRNSKNSQIRSLNEVLDRHRFAYDRYEGIDLTQTIKEDPNQTQWAKERLDFLKLFFRYTRDRPDFEISFSEWIQHSKSNPPQLNTD